jgi:3-oxoacyl-[acyl-carrier protein] reductase
MGFDLSGRTVLITGGSRGLGRAIAAVCGSAGANVCIGYRVRRDEAEASLRDAGGRVDASTLLRLDVCDVGSIEDAVAKVLQAHGRIDAVVNCAGVVSDGLFAMQPAADFDRLVSVNLSGAVNVCRAVVRPMLRERSGVIVNVASLAGIRPGPGQSGYAASKGGLIAFSRALALECAPRGIRVNCLVPGFLDTGSAARMHRTVAANVRERIPLKRFGRASEAAYAALFLLADASAYIVGQSLVVDGGLSG